MTFKRSDLTIDIFQEDDGSFYAEVKNLPGCFTMGETMDELNKNIKEAIIAYAKSIELDAKNYNFHFTKNDLHYA